MKKFTYLFMFVFISIVLMTQVQYAKKKIYKTNPLKNKRLVGVKSVNTPFFSQGNLFITSNNNRVLAHFILKNNNGNGQVISGANVFVNNSKINGTNIPGEYKGFAPLNRNHLGQYPISIRIVTPNKRVLSANGTIDALLKMEISNIFPKQPDKIDVGSPVRINWFFIPRKDKPVTLSITNTANNFKLHSKIYHKNRVIIPVSLIPKRKTVRFKVTVPVIYLRYAQPTHKDSSIKIHVKDEKVLHTFR